MKMSNVDLLELLTKSVELLEEEMEEVSFWDLTDYMLEEHDIDLQVKRTYVSNTKRWQNEVTHIVEIQEEFFQIDELVPATEMQEGSGEDGIFNVFRVRPVEVVKTEYVKA